MSHVVFQYWGIGNLVQTEPLLRALGGGDIVTLRNRSTHELAPFFPKWKFIVTEDGQQLQGSWDDLYLCYPVEPRQFAAVANRVHVPTWSWRGWDKTEAEALHEMLGVGYPRKPEDVIPRLSMPRHVVQRSGAIGMSIGYLKEAGWAQKHWGNSQFREAIQAAWKEGYTTHLFGSQADYDVDGKEIINALELPSSAWKTYFHCPLWEQIEVLAGCRGYLGNDTGLAHVAGALGIPVAEYIVSDRAKNHPAGRCFQFGKETSPWQAVLKLVEMMKDA